MANQDSHQDFGQNSWLVDQMFQEFQKDPSSVDSEWRAFFSADPAGMPVSSTPPTSSSVPSSSPREQHAPAQTSSASQPSSAAAVATPVHTPSYTLSQEVPPRNARPVTITQELPDAGTTALKGVGKVIAKNMDVSLSLPTATSVRDIPAKMLFENRAMINEQLASRGDGKISFTHLIGYAVVQSIKNHPSMNNHYTIVDGKPSIVVPEHINLGIAVDVKGKNGARSLVVAAVKEAENMDFAEFVSAYEDLIAKARTNSLTMDDMSGVTASLTNPGGLGTRHSIPRLTQDQGLIVGVGSMDYPASFAGSSPDRLAAMGIGKLVTLTSTYDHRIIQGAESGEFLRTINQLIADDGFWDDIFRSMRVPYTPIRWNQDTPLSSVDRNTRVMQLIHAYRSRGHLIANTNPLDWKQAGLPVPSHRDLELETYGLTLWDLDRTFNVGGFGGKETMALREVLRILRRAYTLHVGTEYTHILDDEERRWIQDRIEQGPPEISIAEKKYILQKLNSAEALENFLQTKYVGQKRFSLEGAEVLIPLMDSAIDQAAEQGLSEVVIGMPHRGRLNVLTNIVGKTFSKIFTEFEGNIDPAAAGGSGDVKYHLGNKGSYLQMFGDNEIDVSLAANPSHLEAVNPVMEGISRAKQDLIPGGEATHPVMPLQIHGDAAFAGLGIVQETINLSQLPAYSVGGTLHVVVNNQIGFTTTPDLSRSTYYATDIAKGFDSPVFHVNGDDPEAVVWVSRLATEYRKQFGKDVFIDLMSYRRRGHNEADDPSMTQPLMYDKIDGHPSVRSLYTDTLIGRGELTEEDVRRVERDFHEQLESVFTEVRDAEKNGKPADQFGIDRSQKLPRGLKTNISQSQMEEISRYYAEIPDGFAIHPRVSPVYTRRAKMPTEGDIDWASAELLALGSLAHSGKRVRINGEDSQRGTFTQRHGVIFDENTNQPYSPLAQMAEDANNGGSVEIFNSALTEYAGMGFEYGYTVGNQDAIVAWEAQFGDFANGAQTIIDQYVSSGEAKWGQLSSLILMLPHGYEGMGPDHSSARIERFLQLSAEGSMTVAQPSTPANYFHLLRRQGLSEMKRPLVVFTPKSMLRNKAAVSSVEDFTQTEKFQSVLDDPRFAGDTAQHPEVTTVLLTSGKLYYDLEKKRKKDGREDVAIVRLEQLYPIPENRLARVMTQYPHAEVRWVQDEPANQGAWPYLGLNIPERIPGFTMNRVSRRAQSSTATGVAKVHNAEEQQLIEEAFAPADNS